MASNAAERLVTFSGTGPGTLTSPAGVTDKGYFVIQGDANASLNLNGGSGTFEFQMNDGTGWVPLLISALPTPATSTTTSVSFRVKDGTKGGAQYRWYCTAGGGGAIGRIWY